MAAVVVVAVFVTTVTRLDILPENVPKEDVVVVVVVAAQMIGNVTTVEELAIFLPTAQKAVAGEVVVVTGDLIIGSATSKYVMKMQRCFQTTELRSKSAI